MKHDFERKYVNAESLKVVCELGVKDLGECQNLQINLKKCPCTYNCNLKGKCCECLRSHREHDELPACYFPPEVEKTYDRSIRKFVSLHK